jgi:hypothetical protein
MSFLKVLPIAIGLLSANVFSGELHTPRTVIRDTDNINLTANFSKKEAGDLYLATMVNGQLWFITQKGLVNKPEALYKSQSFEGTYTLFNTAAANVTAGVYPIYQVITRANGNPYSQADWSGTGLSQMNFTVKMPDTVGRDYNRDGFPDDDTTRTGFHDERVKIDTDRNHSQQRDENDQHDNGENDHGTNTGTTTPVTIGNSTPTGTPTTPVTSQPTTQIPVTQPITQVPVTTVTQQPSTTTSTATGQLLFDNNCTACHSTPRSIRAAANATSTRNAINRNTGGMSILKSLTDADLTEIARYVQSAP